MATQAQRRSTTRARLLEAASSALLEQGYERLTTTAVVKRSGLSQGALFSHFATKNDLVAATAEHLFAELRAEYEDAFSALATRESVTMADALTLLAESMSDVRYHAALDLYAAARTDADLQASLAPVVERHGGDVWRLASELPVVMTTSEREAFHTLIRLALMALQGAALQVQAHPDDQAADQVMHALRHLCGINVSEDAA